MVYLIVDLLFIIYLLDALLLLVYIVVMEESTQWVVYLQHRYQTSLCTYDVYLETTTEDTLKFIKYHKTHIYVNIY